MNLYLILVVFLRVSPLLHNMLLAGLCSHRPRLTLQTLARTVHVGRQQECHASNRFALLRLRLRLEVACVSGCLCRVSTARVTELTPALCHPSRHHNQTQTAAHVRAAAHAPCPPPHSLSCPIMPHASL